MLLREQKWRWRYDGLGSVKAIDRGVRGWPAVWATVSVGVTMGLPQFALDHPAKEKKREGEINKEINKHNSGFFSAAYLW